MKYHHIWIGVLIAAMSSCATGQKAVTERATQQGWSGGVCCVHGTNYAFTLRIATGNQTLALDTLWLDSKPYALTQDILKKECTDKGCSLEINVQTREGSPGKQPWEEQPVETEVYPGAYKQPTLIYRLGKKRFVYAIENITVFPPVNFP